MILCAMGSATATEATKRTASQRGTEQRRLNRVMRPTAGAASRHRDETSDRNTNSGKSGVCISVARFVSVARFAGRSQVPFDSVTQLLRLCSRYLRPLPPPPRATIRGHRRAPVLTRLFIGAALAAGLAQASPSAQTPSAAAQPPADAAP